MKSVRHYFFLGCYLGIFTALVVLARALPELPGKLKGTSFDLVDLAVGMSGTMALLAAIVLLCGLLGALVGWLQLEAKKRRNTSEESLVVRR